MSNVIDIFGIKFITQDYNKAIQYFKDWMILNKSHQVCIANVHTLVTALNNPYLYNINLNASMVTMDGQPLRWYANAVYRANIKERVCGPELMLRCIEYGLDKGWRHYFYGGRPEVLDKLESELTKKYPEMIVAGSYSPPFRQLTNDEDQVIVDKINDASPHFLWVGLGAPKQEIWIASHLDKINVPIQVGVGAAFDFHAGEIGRAPEILQKIGMEWLYRLWKDPRLWKRYLSTNPVFIYMFCYDWFRVRILKKAPVKRNSKFK